MPIDQEQKLYELRLAIESQMAQTLDYGFTLDELEEFVGSVVDDLREEEQES